MITATVPKPSWYKERGKNLIEEYRGGRECGGSRNSVIRRLAETYNMSDEDVKQLMLDAGLPPAELPERMREGFYEKPRAFADGRAKPTGEGSGLIDRENVLEKLREKCQGCDTYNGVRCRWCETGRAIKIVQEAEDV